MAKYYITGIKKDTISNHTFITDVLIHLVENDKVHAGTVIGKDDVIKLIKNRETILTALWNYVGIYWSEGESVTYETKGGKEYLRTKPDNQQKDNLLHLLPLANLGL